MAWNPAMSEATAPVAGRSHTAVRIGIAAAGYATPVALLASLPGLVYAAGFDHLAYGLGLLAGVILAGLLIAPNVVRTGGVSISDALYRRFGRATAIASAIVAVLVVLPLLAAEYALVAVFAESGLGMAHHWAVVAALVLSAAGTCLDDRNFGRLAVAAYALIAASLLVPLVSLAVKMPGVTLPHIAYGQTLAAISGLEEKLLENGLVDFDTFSVHVTPFLRLPQLGFFALVVSLALGTAVLLPLVAALAGAKRPTAVRLSGAWAALFVMLVLMSVPALAAYAKLEIYGAMTAGTPLANLPSWLAPPLDAGFARIHGTSSYLLHAVAEAVRAGHQDATSIADALALNDKAYVQWTALGAETQEAILAAARTLLADPQAVAWNVYVKTVLPAAAGNEGAMLTQAALVIEPTGLFLALPGLTGTPAWLGGSIFMGMIIAALVMASVLIRSLFAVGLVGSADTQSWRTLALGFVPAALAAAIATVRIDDLVTIVIASLSLGASALFPVLAFGLAWKRATAAGAVAAIVVGAGVAQYYEVGTQIFPVSFYKTWAPLSNAGEFAIEGFRAAELDMQEAEDDEAKAQAAASLEVLARGTPGRPGLANWAGIDSASGAVFGVPLGILALVLVSLLTSSRRRDQP